MNGQEHAAQAFHSPGGEALRDDDAEKEESHHVVDTSQQSHSHSMPGTFGRASGGSASASSSSAAVSPTASPKLKQSSSRPSLDAFERTSLKPINIPAAAAAAAQSSSSKGKQRAFDQGAVDERATKLGGASPPPPRRSGERSTRQSGDFDGHEWYGTSLSPRLQAAQSSGEIGGLGGATFEQGTDGGMSNGRRLRGVGGSSPPPPPPPPPPSSDTRGYRAYERELETQKQSQHNRQSLGYVESQAFDSHVHSSSPAADDRASRQAKRVSLGQVSIESGPAVDIGTMEKAHRRDSSASFDARTSSPSRGNRRRRTLTDSARSKAKLSTLRERTISEPASSTDHSLGEKKSGFWMFEGGRVRKASTTDQTKNVKRPRQLSDTAIAHPPQRRFNYLQADNAISDFSCLSSAPQQRPSGLSPSMVGVAGASRPSSSIMRWDPALSTAISLRNNDSGAGPPWLPKVSVDDVFLSGRPSTGSNAASQGRALAYFHLSALSNLRSRLPSRPSRSLAPIRYNSLLARLHHSLLIFQAYLHVPATIFFDYNALYTIVQIAIHADAGSSSAAWWIAAGLYAASFAIWLVAVVIFYDYILSYRRRWINPRPFALPIYLSSAAFTLTSIRSFSFYSLFSRARSNATRRDFIIESAWFYGQNWPTILTLLPRGIILAILLVIYNPSSASPRPSLGDARDTVYFDRLTGLLTSFSYVILLVNVAWIAWRILVLISAWSVFVIVLGPKYALQRERDAYKYDDSELALSEFRLSSSTRPLVDSTVRVHGEEYGNDNNLTDVERPSLHVRPQSLDIPRRSHSLYSSYKSVNARSPEHARKISSTGNIDSITPPKATSGGLLPTKSATPGSSPVRLPGWAWRARAEERISALLLECETTDNQSDGDESWEWLEAEEQNDDRNRFPPSHVTPRQATKASESRSTPRASDEIFATRQVRRTSGGPSLPIITLPEESIMESVSNASHLHTNAVEQPNDEQDAYGSHASSGSLSPSTSLPRLQHKPSTASFPFPRRKSEEMSAPAVAAVESDVAQVNGQTDEAIPMPAQLATRTPRNSFGVPVQQVPHVSTPEQRQKKRSITTSVSSSRGGGDSMHTATGGRTTSDASVQSSDTVRDATKASALARQTKDVGGAAWWANLFGTKNNAPSSSSSSIGEQSKLTATGAENSVSTSLRQASNGETQSQQEMMQRGLTGRQVSVPPNANSTGEAVTQTGDPLGSGVTDDDASFEGDVDDLSMETEDSEERRLWQEFPEQSRRHPPGLIAFELQQRQLEEENQRRSIAIRGQQPDGSTSSTFSGHTNNTIATGNGTPPMNASDNVVPNGGNSGGGGASSNTSATLADQVQSMRDSSLTSVLPTSPSEGLLPIQEESWSSTSATDEELEFLHSNAPSAFIVRRS